MSKRTTSCRGTAMTETVLVLVPLLIVVGMAPWVAGMFLDLQIGRTEAHRDMFDKTTTMMLMPEALMDNHVNGEMASQFGVLNPTTRQHAFASFPPAVAASINAILDPPDFSGIEFTSTLTLDLFNEGFPNATVEGWEYVRRKGPLEFSSDLHFMTYGATVRSPWTYLGYPWVATQDLVFEPKKMQDWQGAQVVVDDDMRERLKLAE